MKRMEKHASVAREYFIRRREVELKFWNQQKLFDIFFAFKFINSRNQNSLANRKNGLLQKPKIYVRTWLISKLFLFHHQMISKQTQNVWMNSCAIWIWLTAWDGNRLNLSIRLDVRSDEEKVWNSKNWFPKINLLHSWRQSKWVSRNWLYKDWSICFCWSLSQLSSKLIPFCS